MAAGISKVAYLCDGLVPECSGKLNCYKYPGCEFDSGRTCKHTFDISHAKFGVCENPENEVPQRFKQVINGSGHIIGYFELPEGDEPE